MALVRLVLARPDVLRLPRRATGQLDWHHRATVAAVAEATAVGWTPWRLAGPAGVAAALGIVRERLPERRAMIERLCDEADHWLSVARADVSRLPPEMWRGHLDRWDLEIIPLGALDEAWPLAVREATAARLDAARRVAIEDVRRRVRAAIEQARRHVTLHAEGRRLTGAAEWDTASAMIRRLGLLAAANIFHDEDTASAIREAEAALHRFTASPDTAEARRCAHALRQIMDSRP